MIQNKIFFYCFFIFLLSCGYKTSPFVTTDNKEVKDFFSKYKVFYRQNILILQAEINFKEEFLWENLKVFSTEKKLVEKEQIIKKRKFSNAIELELNLPIKEKFFNLVYQHQEKQFSSNWLKAVKTTLPPLPQASYFFHNKEKEEVLLNIAFQNLNNYYAIFYTENSIFPLLEKNMDLKEYSITSLQAQNLFLRYRNSYGNESNKIDISIKK